MKGIKITFALLWLGINIVSAGASKSGPDYLVEGKEGKLDSEAETRKVLAFNTSDWKTFAGQNPKFEIKYPAGLSVAVDDNNKLTLSHAVPFAHFDPCDMSDHPRQLSELTDFKLEIEVVGGGLKQAIIRGEESAAPHFLADDTVVSLERYALTIRSLKGYELPYGTHGCGGLRYYFPLGKSFTLLVRRKFVAELDPIIGNYRDKRQLPGVIFPDEEERLAKLIISTFSLLE